MLQKTSGIVLHKIRYSESSLIVKFYTRDLGLISVMLHGTGKKKSKSKSSLLQPLNILDLEIDHKEKREIHHLKDIRTAFIYNNIPFEINKSSVLLFLNEVLYRTIKEEETNEALFHFIKDSLIAFDYLQAGYFNFHLYFLIKLSGFLGFNPMNNYDPESNKYFHLQEGNFAPMPGSPDEVMDEEDSYMLSLFLKKDFREIKMTNADRNTLLHMLLKYYSHHIPRFPEIKSHQVLKEILRG